MKMVCYTGPVFGNNIAYFHLEPTWAYKLNQEHPVPFAHRSEVLLGGAVAQCWRSGERTRLPPMWPGFDSKTRRHMWSGYSSFPSPQNQYLI